MDNHLEIKTSKELRTMSKKQLAEYSKSINTLALGVQTELDRRAAVKMRRGKVKAQYASLINRDYTYHLNTVALANLVKKSVENGTDVTGDVYEKLVETATEQDHKPRDKAYPCPACGEFTLFPAFYDTHLQGRETATICCNDSDCGFEIKVDNQYSFGDKASWWGLEDWLIKHGYMTQSDKIE